MLVYIFFANDFLRWFTENRIKGWEDTAESWLITAVVIAVLCAGLMLAYKLLRKKAARNIVEQTWSRRRTALLILIGLLPVFLFILTAWYTSSDFFNVMRVSGLFKGILFAWLLYLLFMIVGHLASPWRRELI
jgi:succinate dehydrogenase hydrophobic anchor subunit